jgi:hypothetical protein
MSEELKAIFEQLDRLTVDERRRYLIKLIECQQPSPLRLPARDGLRANLSGGVDLSSRTLLEEYGLRCLKRKTWWSISLQGLNLEGADLSGAEMWGCNLQGVDLMRANLAGANLQTADLRGGWFAQSNLQGANLRFALLQDTQLYGADLTHVYLSDAQLWNTRFNHRQIGGSIGEEIDARRQGADAISRAKDFEKARRAYAAIKVNFESLGDHDGVLWAYRKERRMEKAAKFWKAISAIQTKRWWAGTQDLGRSLIDQTVELLCDYGESVSRG